MHTLPPYAVTSPVRHWRRRGCWERSRSRRCDGSIGTEQVFVGRWADCVGICHFQTVGKASALGKRTSRSEAVRLVPLRLSTSGSVSYNAAYTHPAPVRLPLSSSQSTCEEVTSSYHNMPGSYQDNGYEDSQISALLPIYYQ